jgi:hypothetical protein
MTTTMDHDSLALKAMEENAARRLSRMHALP